MSRRTIAIRLRSAWRGGPSHVKKSIPGRGMAPPQNLRNRRRDERLRSTMFRAEMSQTRQRPPCVLAGIVRHSACLIRRGRGRCNACRASGRSVWTRCSFRWRPVFATRKLCESDPASPVRVPARPVVRNLRSVTRWLQPATHWPTHGNRVPGVSGGPGSAPWFAESTT